MRKRDSGVFVTSSLYVVAALAVACLPAAADNPLKIATLHWYAAGNAAFGVGAVPSHVAFDGFSVWAPNHSDNTVTRLRASDGAPLGTFAVGTQPFGVAFDGANIWVANFYSGSVSKLRASDGKALGTFAVGGQPFALAFDGADIWVTNPASGTVSKL